MRFLSVDGISFARYVEPFRLSLDRQGLVLVEGRNFDNGDAFDSNGAGKSMLFEAIKWCLFGKMSRYGDERLGAEEVTFENHDANVRVVFENDRGRFQVHRQRGVKGSPKLIVSSLQHGEWKPVQGSGLHAAEGTESVVTILGFDYQTLRYALTLEGSSLDIVSDGFGPQMKVLESILRFDIFTEAQKRIKVFASEQYRAVERLVDEMDRHELILRQAEGMKADLETLDESTREAELTLQIAAWNVALKDSDKVRSRLTRQRAANDLDELQWRGAESHLNIARHRLDSFSRLLEKSVCPECEQPVDAAHMQHVLGLAQQRVKELTEDYEISRDRHLESQQRRYTLEDAIDAIETKEKELSQMQSELADLLKRKEKRLTVIASHDARVTAAEAEVARLTAEIAAERRVHHHADGWATRGYQALKETTLAKATPILDSAAMHYGQILSDGAITVTFNTMRDSRRDKLISASGETGPTYESMSSGEKRRAQIVVALSLRALARWRVGTPINFGVWDEVVDSLDESGINRVMAVLQQDMDELSSVFVISHSPTLKALFPGARTLRVEREHGISRLIS